MRRPSDQTVATAHAIRFREVSTRYPRRVAEAYGGDIAAAAAATDAQVAGRVAAWEIAQGLTPRDWRAIGREERDEPRLLADVLAETVDLDARRFLDIDR